MSLFFYLFIFTINLCPHWRKRWAVNDLVLNQEDKPQTHRTVHELSRETGIYRSSLSRIICNDLHLKCFKRRHGQELTGANCAARMKRTKLLLQKFPQYATDFVFFTDEKVFSVASSDNRQNKVSGRLRELLKKKLMFSSLQALCGLPLPGRLSTVPVSRNFLNSLLTPHFVQLFSGNSSCQPLCCVPLQIQTFYQNLVLVTFIPCWLLTNISSSNFFYISVCACSLSLLYLLQWVKFHRFQTVQHLISSC